MHLLTQMVSNLDIASVDLQSDKLLIARVRRYFVLTLAIFCVFAVFMPILSLAQQVMRTYLTPNDKRTLVVCLDFDPQINDDDQAALRRLLDRIPCVSKFVNIVVVPYNGIVSNECLEAVSQFGGNCLFLPEWLRANQGLQDAPSFAIFDSTGASILPVGRRSFALANIPVELLVPSCTVKVYAANEIAHSCWLRHEDCPEITFSLPAKPTLFPLIPGNYEIVREGKTIGKVRFSAQTDQESFGVYADTVAHYSPPDVVTRIIRDTVVVSRVDTVHIENKFAPPTNFQRQPSRYRSIGPFLLGFDVGGIAIPFKYNEKIKYEGLFAGGASVRLIGLFGIQAMTLWSDTVQSYEGTIVTADLEPALLSYRDLFSFALRGGYMWLRNKSVGPLELRSYKYKEFVVGGGSLFVGRVGRDSMRGRSRLGVLVEVLYCRPKMLNAEYFQLGNIYSAEMGGIIVGAYLQIEF